MGETIIANACASIIERELALRLTEQSLMIADETFYFSSKFFRTEKMQHEREFAAMPVN